MAIKAGQILHVAGGQVIDRIQTGGAGQLNIPQEKVYELGNYKSVGTVRDVPDLSFSLECLEVDTEVEALLVGKTDPGADAPGTMYDLNLNKPIDIVSPWKNPYGAFATVHGVAVPGLVLESASYRYGLTENAGETFTLQGDSIFYTPGSPYVQTFEGDGLLTDFTVDNVPMLTYDEGAAEVYALSVSVNGVRQYRGTDYDDEDGETVTFLPGHVPPADSTVSVVYASATAEDYPGGDVGGTPPGVHQGTSIKPAAIRGKDIDVYFAVPGVDLGTGAGDWVRWTDVQSATIDWRITLEADMEFGNPRAVAREATDVPAVTGAIEVKPRSVGAFFERLRTITGVASTSEVIGPQTSVAGKLAVVLRNPGSGGTTKAGVEVGDVLKVHYQPQVRFTVPGYEGRVQQKLTATLNYESDDGVLQVFKGAPSAAALGGNALPV